MKAAIFIFTRLFEADYSFYALPPEDMLPENVSSDFKNKVVELLNVRKITSITTPQYILIKLQGWILWGIAGLNTEIFPKKDYTEDCKKRPVKSFVGVVLKDSNEVALPYSDEFFEHIFTKAVQPIWNKRSVSTQNIEHDITSKVCILTPIVSRTINLNNDFIRVFHNKENVIDILSECLGHKGDISAATNIVELERVTNPQIGYFTNVVMLDDSNEKYEDLPTKQICRKCQKEVFSYELKNGFCTECQNQEKYLPNLEDNSIYETSIENDVYDNRVESGSRKNHFNKQNKNRNIIILVLAWVILTLLYSIGTSEKQWIKHLFPSKKENIEQVSPEKPQRNNRQYFINSSEDTSKNIQNARISKQPIVQGRQDSTRVPQ